MAANCRLKTLFALIKIWHAIYCYIILLNRNVGDHFSWARLESVITLKPLRTRTHLHRADTHLHRADTHLHRADTHQHRAHAHQHRAHAHQHRAHAHQHRAHAHQHRAHTPQALLLAKITGETK